MTYDSPYRPLRCLRLRGACVRKGGGPPDSSLQLIRRAKKEEAAIFLNGPFDEDDDRAKFPGGHSDDTT